MRRVRMTDAAMTDAPGLGVGSDGTPAIACAVAAKAAEQSTPCDPERSLRLHAA